VRRPSYFLMHIFLTVKMQSDAGAFFDCAQDKLRNIPSGFLRDAGRPLPRLTGIVVDVAILLIFAILNKLFIDMV